MRLLKKIIASILIIAIVFPFMSVPFVSCTVLDSFAMPNSFKIIIGEQLDLREYAGDEFSVIIADESIAVESDGIINAIGVGTTSITVKKGLYVKTASLTVVYADMDFELKCDRSVYLTSPGTILTFTVEFAQKVDSSSENIVWYVDDVIVNRGSLSYSYAVDSYGTFTVCAEILDVKKQTKIICYHGFKSDPAISSDVNAVEEPENGVYRQISFNVAYELYDGDPQPFVQWYVNDNIRGEGGQLVFVPSQASNYIIYALVNGIKTNEISFIAAGETEVFNLSYDFDSSYPNRFVRWECSVSGYEYEVVIESKSYFVDGDLNYLDITNIVDNDEHAEVMVRCLGGGYFLPSEYEMITTEVITSSMIKYLSRTFFDGNYYMTSDQEVYDIVSYALTFRPDSKMIEKNGEMVPSISFTVYMGYITNYSMQTLMDNAWEYALQTGMYYRSSEGSVAKGKTLTIGFTFMTVNVPEQSDLTQKIDYAQLLRPQPQKGNGRTLLPIDERKSAKVSTSEELYYIVEKGYKPEPVVGSVAERIYIKAKNILSYIIESGMSEVEKADAIYEWISFNTVYDYEVLAYSDLKEGCKKAAYYLEGVFDDGYAVCDGISKAFVLLCNMEGIDCVRVVGTVNSSGIESQHAWNKVKIDGKWYAVDITWADTLISWENGKKYEIGTHYYFLRTDSEFYTHKPNYAWLYPSCTDSFDWYSQEVIYEGNKVSLYVDGDNTENKLRQAMAYALKNKSFEYSFCGTAYVSEYYCIELKISPEAKINIFYNISITKILIELGLNPLKVKNQIFKGEVLIFYIER